MREAKILDPAEFLRLEEMIAHPLFSAVMTDLDGTATKTDPQTGQVPNEYLPDHRANILKFAHLVNQGILVVPTTNRRKEKATAYTQEIIEAIKQISVGGLRKNPITGGSYLEMYWGSGVGGMDCGTGQVFDDFQLVFPEAQQRIVVQQLVASGVILSQEKEHVEMMEGKINIYTYAPATNQERKALIQNVRDVLDRLIILQKGRKGAAIPPFILLEVKDAGEQVISILPASANKARPKKYIKQRYGLTERQILKLVDQPQPSGADREIVRYGGIHVGVDIDNFPKGVISTKRAIGLTGPRAVFWILENVNFVPLSSSRHSAPQTQKLSIF